MLTSFFLFNDDSFAFIGCVYAYVSPPWFVNDDLVTVSKDVAVAHFQALCQHLRGRTDKNHKNPQSRLRISRPNVYPGASWIRRRSADHSTATVSFILLLSYHLLGLPMVIFTDISPHKLCTIPCPTRIHTQAIVAFQVSLSQQLLMACIKLWNSLWRNTWNYFLTQSFLRKIFSW
jgi:hypothetical protein